MRRALALSIVVMLIACSLHTPVLTVDALAHDPHQLYALRHRCAVARPHMDNATCRLVDAAYARRFFLGLGGAGEYQTLTELPPIPTSFEAPQGDRP
ncbi:Lipoprotein [Burkholderia pseudomallei]